MNCSICNKPSGKYSKCYICTFKDKPLDVQNKVGYGKCKKCGNNSKNKEGIAFSYCYTCKFGLQKKNEKCKFIIKQEEITDPITNEKRIIEHECLQPTKGYTNCWEHK